MWKERTHNTTYIMGLDLNPYKWSVMKYKDANMDKYLQ
jgi:hypothetical protein